MRFLTPVDTAQEVIVWMDNTIQRPWRCFVYLMQKVLGSQKRPHFSKTELYCLWNAVSAAMVKAGRTNGGKNLETHSRDLGIYPTLLEALRTFSAQKMMRSRALNVATWLRAATGIVDTNHCATVLYNNPMYRLIYSHGAVTPTPCVDGI